jgi:Spy/CpxP family protein refolding chaperone
MKRILRLIGISSVLGLTAASLGACGDTDAGQGQARLHEQKPGAGPAARGGQQVGEETSGKARAKDPVEKALKQLQLRPEQQRAIEQLKMEARQRYQPVMAEKSSLMRTVAAQIQRGKIDRCAIDSQIKSLASQMARAHVGDRKALERLHEILDPQQRAQFVAALSQLVQDHEQAHARMLDKISNKLQLSPEQRESVERIFKALDDLAEAEKAAEAQNPVEEEQQPGPEQLGPQQRAPEEQGPQQRGPQGQIPQGQLPQQQLQGPQQEQVEEQGPQQQKQQKQQKQAQPTKHATKAEILEAFKGDQFDLDQIAPIGNVEKKIEHLLERHAAAGEALVSVLNPEQRAKLARMLMRRAERLGGGAQQVIGAQGGFGPQGGGFVGPQGGFFGLQAGGMGEEIAGCMQQLGARIGQMQQVAQQYALQQREEMLARFAQLCGAGVQQGAPSQETEGPQGQPQQQEPQGQIQQQAPGGAIQRPPAGAEQAEQQGEEEGAQQQGAPEQQPGAEPQAQPEQREQVERGGRGPGILGTLLMILD